jgi:enoyl-CoA hydratase/carnithine racemase
MNEGTVEIETGTPYLAARCTSGVAEVILNDPERHNTLSRDMLSALPTVVGEVIGRSDVRVLVVSGAGGRSFASGADIRDIEAGFSGAAGVYEKMYKDALRAFREVEIPLIAMIDGYCLGAGLYLALAADLRYASNRSTFGIPGARIGLGHPHADQLLATVGRSRAAEILFTGRRYTANEAYRMVLVDLVAPWDELANVVVDGIASEIASNAPLSIRSAKLALRESSKPPGERDVAAIAAALEACQASSDLVEGRRAFVERRPPRFTGR